MKRGSFTLGVALLALSGNIALRAQTAVDGAIGGSVEDKTGAVVAGATIVIHNNETNAERKDDQHSNG